MTDAAPAADALTTIPQLFFHQAARYGSRTFLRVKRRGSYQDIAWISLAQDVRRFAAYLLDEGVQPDDRVALLSENRPEWVIADLAIQSVGALSVPIYPSHTTPEIEQLLRDCEARMLIVSTAAQAQKCLELPQRLPCLQRLILCEGEGVDAIGQGCSWHTALATGEHRLADLTAVLDERLRSLTSDRVATLIYTSGTTGEPKGVMLTQENFLSNCRAARTAIPIGETDLHLSFLPLSHVFERMAGYYLMMMQGATIAYAENMDTLPENMLEIHPTVMLGVPRFFEKLHARIQERLATAPAFKRALAYRALNVGRRSMPFRLAHQPLPWWLRWPHQLAHRLVFTPLQERLGGRLRFFVSGSAPLSPAIAEFFYSAGVTILEGYGLTETSPVIAVNRLEALRFGSVGLPLDGVDVRIADDGEILTRGPHVMRGYYRRPEDTAAVMVDGWFRTGDIGHLDADGFLFITDRKKDLIKTSGGKFVAPQKIENLLTADPYIAQACVFGDRERFIVALIVPRFDRLAAFAASQHLPATDPTALVQHPAIHRFLDERVQICQRALASFEQIKRFAILDHELTQAAGELTPTLKAKRRQIAQKYQAVLRSLYDQSPPTTPTA